ncbi:hypothetical protein JS533_009250 [Bifidobacterium amazonense]|uniref:Uncharacterized protein n=1 Tax=Bifidobacterium amazonense TaxID=2809027 RepID=A0ABS9VWK0_9BIFI|nr:hypothetical protein [Bifidobacterium amazonense]MCH9276448.1 hypothetical protein [Bifidobacterium amazonense]
MEKTPQKKRRERIARTLAGVAAAMLAVGLMLYYLPLPQRIRVEGDAYRVDDAATSTSYTISMDAVRLRYLFQSDRLTGHITIRPADGGDAVVDRDFDQKMFRITNVTHPGTDATVQYFNGSWSDVSSGLPDLILASGLISPDGSTMMIDIDDAGIYLAPASNAQDAERIKTEFNKVFGVDEWINTRQ